MATFKYTAISKNGSNVSGVIEGYDKMDAVRKIKMTYPIISKIDEVKEGADGGILSMEIGGNKLNAKAFTLMCSQFAIILRSGIPLGRTVKLIADKMTDKKLKKVLNQVSDDVEAGRSLTASFEAHGEGYFPLMFIETVRAGEESGNLPRAFETVYQHFDKQAKIKGKVKSALTYPIFVLVIAVVVVIVLMVKVVPTFTSIFDSYDAEIPGVTKALIAISDFFSASWWILLIIVVVLVIAYKIYSGTEQGRINVAKAKLKIPVLGNINILTAASEFANNMCTLVGSGLSITRAVRITSRVMSNYFIGTEVGKITGRIEEGHSLGDSLREADVLPDILVDMTAVGEETGELEDTLNTVAGYYDAELDMATKAALDKLEPAVLVFMAVVAGFIVIAIYVAMFEMYNVM